MNNISDRIAEYLAQHRSDIISELFELAAIPSVEAAHESGAPFGKECRQALDLAVELFSRHGIDALVCDGGKYGIACFGSGDREIGIFAHTDVVPVEPEKWIYTAPFTPVEHGGYLIGRGVHDNKAGVIMALYSVLALRDLDIFPDCLVTVFLGANEETGMEDIAAYVRQQPMPDFSIVPDNSYPICLGEKGIFHLRARMDKPLTSIRQWHGGIATNVILGEAAVTLELSAADGIAEFCRGNDKYSYTADGDTATVTAYGITSHGSRPEGSLNACRLLCDALLASRTLPASDRERVTEIAYMLSDDYGAVFGIDASDPYFGRTTTTNGIIALTDGHFEMTFDIRYGTVLDADTVYDRVREGLLSHGFSMTDGENRPGFRVGEDSPEAVAMLDIYKSLSGNNSVRPYYSGGGTYARHLTNAISIGCTAPYIAAPALDLPAGHGDVHQSDEVIPVDGLMESIRLLTLMLHSTGNIK